METRMIALLLCAILALTLCACGGDDKDNTPAVSGTKSGDIEFDDGFILPEDGKIEFGKNNKKNEETDEASDTTGNTDRDSDNTSSETTKPEDTAKSAESETSKPTDGGWGDVQWN